MQNAALKVFSARARESALRVRRHQDALGASEQPTGMANPKIRARVAEILAEKAAKGKKKAAHGKGKGRKAPDPAKAKAKADREKAAAAKKVEREKAKAERAGKQLSAATARETAKRERATAKAERVAAQAKKQAAQQAKLKAAAHAKRAKNKASASAKQERTKTATAAQAKRKQAAKERLAAQAKKQSEAQAKQKQAVADRTAKQKQAQQHKTRVLAEKIKRGEKLSASDQVDAEDAGLVKKTGTKAMTEIDDLAIKAGARHSKMDASHLDEAARHLHAAGATCPDCAPDEEGDDEAAGKAIKSIMDNPAWYAQHECNDIMQAGSALSTLAMLIQSELSEEDEDDADVSQLCDAARTLIKFIGSELDELEGAAGDAAEGRTAGDVPMAKGIEIGTLENGEEIAVVSGSAVKALGGDGQTGGYLIKFGGDGDLSQWRDVFTKSANYGKHTKTDVWVHHRMLPGLGKKQLTNQAEIGMDDEGVFVKHLLDLRNTYEAKLYGMVQAGKLGWSSGTAPHLVERKSLGDGRHEVTQWTLGLDASYTPMPAGGFVVNAGAMKSLFDDAGIDLLNAMYIDDSPEAIKANSDRGDGLKAESERARRLSIQQRMIHLRETMNGPTS